MNNIGNYNVNLADSRILDFVCRSNIPANERLTLDVSDDLKSRNMSLGKGRTEPGLLGEFEVNTFVVRKYVLYKDGQIFGTAKFTMPLITVLKVELSSVLGLNKQGLTSEEVDYIENAFMSYAAGGAESIADYISRCLREFSTSTGRSLNTDLFDIVPKVTVEFVSATIILDKDNNFKRMFDGSNSKEYLPPWHREGDNLRGDGYSYGYYNDDTYIKTPPVLSRDHIVDVPKGSSDDEKLRAVTEKLKEDIKKEENCAAQNLTPFIIPIAKIKLMEDQELRTEWGYRKTCGGGGMHFYWPIRYVRDLNYNIYASLYYPSADDREVIIKKVFEEALQDAAIIALLTESLESALEAFKLAFFQRLKERTIVAVECIIPEFTGVEEFDDWRRAN
ncbi:hypothetical protein [Pseudomonas putida]|uniref:hypothetical protein n=1 Tax=Pseudomonas putida TaxID=303 RepID=UPI0039E1FDBE